MIGTGTTEWAIVTYSPRLFQTIHHIIPLDDLRYHELGKPCWCRPTEDDEEPGVLRHNSMDGREAYERGERSPS